jgi:AcrR family transcriptional regulator
MARTVKHDDHAAKRSEILDLAQRLIYTKGYEQMSIQDLLDGLGISKGAFYHYFDSKQALLEGIVERTVEQISHVLAPLVHDPKLQALKKFQIIMDTGAQWKAARMDFMFAILYAWYNDENALARQKITASMYTHVRPWLAEVFKQGNEQGVMSTPFPEQAAPVVLTLMVGMGDAIAQLLMRVSPASTPQQRKVILREMAGVSAAYNSAIERFLGMQAGALELFSTKLMKQWVNHPGSAQDTTTRQAAIHTGGA